MYPHHHFLQGPAPASQGMAAGFAVAHLLIWVLIILVVAMLVSKFMRHGHGHGHFGHFQDPVEIAKARYAKGEITKKEFEELKKDLA